MGAAGWATLFPPPTPGTQSLLAAISHTTMCLLAEGEMLWLTWERELSAGDLRLDAITAALELLLELLE